MKTSTIIIALAGLGIALFLAKDVIKEKSKTLFSRKSLPMPTRDSRTA